MPLLFLLLPLLLIDAPLVMEAVRQSCRLFVFSVMPGLFPYLTLVTLLLSRLRGGKPAWLVVLLGWCGGSPAGAGLLRQCPALDAVTCRRLAVTCATMSPMFLLGTVPQWLNCAAAGPCLLAAVVLGGWLAGLAANLACPHGVQPDTYHIIEETPALTFAQAVESAARTMLMVCGVMAMLRTASALGSRYLAQWPALCLALQTLLEVTNGVEQLSALPLPMAWRLAWIAGATGFGGMAILLQNRALLPAGLLSFPRQVILQALHGACSFVLGLGLALMLGL